MFTGHLSWILAPGVLDDIAMLSAWQTISLPLNSIEGTNETKLVVVPPSAEILSVIAVNGSPFLNQRILAGGFEPELWQASSMDCDSPAVMFVPGVIIRISRGFTVKRYQK